MNKQPVSYLQTDPRWANQDYSAKGEKTDIRESGCGPTAAAMLIETLTGKKFTPADACKWALSHGYKAPHQGTYYSYFVPQFAAFGLGCYQLSWTNTYHDPNSPIHDRALQLLKQGNYLIALMKKGTWTGSGHFVVVWWEDNKIRINDPASTKDIRLNGNINTFRNECAYYWVIDATKYNNPVVVPPESEEELMPMYKHLQDVPESYRPTIRKLMEDGTLKGYKDPDPNSLDDNVIDVSEDFCRTMTILDRKGIL